jgi:hypothetical protein
MAKAKSFRYADFYDAEEAAGRLGVHKESLLRAVRLGTTSLTAFEAAAPRTRRKYYFKKTAVDGLGQQK